MRIIKEGNQDNVAKFDCTKCGCKFECEQDEFWTETTFVLTSYPEQYYVYANCPVCHKVCHPEQYYVYANCPVCHKVCRSTIHSNMDAKHNFSTATATSEVVLDTNTNKVVFGQEGVTE